MRDGPKLLLHQHECDQLAVPKLSNLAVSGLASQCLCDAAGGKPTGFCPQAGQAACHVFVKITAAPQAGQAPSFPQLHLPMRGNAAHIWLTSVSLSSSFSYPL